MADAHIARASSSHCCYIFSFLPGVERPDNYLRCLAGVVTDQSGAVVPDADVGVKDNAKGTTQSSKTGREGVYQFFFLAPGRYTLKIRHPGFREEKRTVNVLLGPAVSVNVTLAIAEARSEITVSEEAPPPFGRRQ
jgi:hypothetical protein